MLAGSERDLLVGQSYEDKPSKATDGPALPEGSVYLARDKMANTVTEYVRVDGEWVFSKTYSTDKPIEHLLARQVVLLQQMAIGLSLLTGTNLEEATA